MIDTPTLALGRYLRWSVKDGGSALATGVSNLSAFDAHCISSHLYEKLLRSPSMD
jgi:hypothetical protein